jgi:ankyrin repeat protein
MAYELASGRSVLTSRLPNGDTALHAAVEHGDVELAAALIQKGADILATNKQGKTAWTVAQARHDADILRLFEGASAAFGPPCARAVRVVVGGTLTDWVVGP